MCFVHSSNIALMSKVNSIPTTKAIGDNNNKSHEVESYVLSSDFFLFDLSLMKYIESQ